MSNNQEPKFHSRIITSDIMRNVFIRYMIMYTISIIIEFFKFAVATRLLILNMGVIFNIFGVLIDITAVGKIFILTSYIQECGYLLFTKSEKDNS